MKILLVIILLPFAISASQAQTLPVSSTGPAQAESLFPGFSASSVPASAVSSAPAADSLPGMVPVPESPAGSDTDDGPWEVAETAAEGNIHVKAKVVLKAVKARKNALYYKEDVNKDIQAILGLGSMETASVDIKELVNRPVSKKFAGLAGSTSAVKVTYIVAERPLIKKILLDGQKELSRAAVLDAMSLKVKDHLDELKLKEDAAKVASKYHEKGYIDAQVDADAEVDSAASTCTVRLKIREGKRARVAEVSFIGASAFPQKKLAKKMKNRPKKIYSPPDLDEDFKKVEIFHKNNGYQDFKIESSTVTFNDDRSRVFIKLNVSEGPRYRFGVTTFAGNKVYSSKELLELLEYRRGKIFNQDRFDDTIRAIQEKYADKGYLRAVVKPEKTDSPATGEMDVHFVIEENSVVYVDHVDVEGNQATKTYVLKREVVQKEGTIFSASKIRKSQERILNLGFIDDVQPSIQPTADPDKVDLAFDITEGKPGMLTAGAGVSSLDGLVGTLSLQHMNLFGRAHRTSLSWQFGSRVNDYSISWTTPWIGNSPTSFGLDLFNTRRLRPYGSATLAYAEKRTGGRVRLGPRFQDDKYHINLAYGYEKISIANVTEVFKGTLAEGTSVTSSISVEFVRDTRDNIWDPTRGTKLSLGVEFTGGPLQGDVDYYKPSMGASWNYKLFSIGDYPFVFALANRFGFVGRHSDTKSIPVFEKYFLGGPDTVRGYNITAQVGPPEGGKVFDVFNAEFRFPLARERRRTIVQWAFFFDIGNSWDRFDHINTRFGSGVKNLKAGAGFGIRFTTPAFPIRLDWGYGFNHKSGEQPSEIYFTMGNLF
ncbi:MAG: outer membrane protein assembly factor BamA [bacterium]